MDLKFYLSVFLRRLPWFLLFLAAGTAAGLTLARVLPAVYVAQARLVVESEQIPDELAASTVQTQATEQLQIIQQRILARDTLIDMANRLQIYGDTSAAPRRLSADEIVDDLRARILIQTTGGTPAGSRAPVQATFVTVSFKAPTAQLAAAVANEVVTLILREDVSMRTSVARQTLDFFDQEVQRLDEELSRQGAAILAFKQANQDALPDSLDFRRSQQSALQERLVTLDRQESELRERRTQVERMKAAAAQGAAVTGTPQTEDQKQLQSLRDELARARAVLSPTNPRVKMLEAQIVAQEQVVAAQIAAQMPASADGAPLSPLDLQLADIDGQLNFITAQRTQAKAELARLTATIDATPANAIQLGVLERDFANTRAQYDEAVAKKARAETGEVIEALAKGQRISVIEQAVTPTEPDSPNRLLLAAGGVGLGLMLGFGVVLLLELLNAGIRRPAEITAKLGVTPFATVPYMRTAAQVLRRRMMIGGAMAAAMVGIPLALWLVHTQVMPLDLIIDRFVAQIGLA
jgi:uncharacterized protein involved in exopolysaccharide biosynthesis